MLPVHELIWHEATARRPSTRTPEPAETMDDPAQIAAYVRAYRWGGPTSALQLHHMRELSRLIRPGDTVLDLACGPGPLLLELAAVYSDAHFIGADLSEGMLRHLKSEAAERGLRNVEVLHEDVRLLPSFDERQVDVVISTSALHHLPTVADLVQVFRRTRSLLGSKGGFYFFDFGLLRSPKAQAICVADVAKLASPITVGDYEMSLRAAFPIPEVLASAAGHLPRPFQASTSALVDFFYFIQSPSRAPCSLPMKSRLEELWRGLSVPMKLEHVMLRLMRRRHRFAA